MKKFLAAVLVLAMLVSAFAVVAAADYEYDNGSTQYNIITAKSVEFTNNGEAVTTDRKNPAHSAETRPQGNGTIDVLVDGDPLASATAFSTKGIVLIMNGYTKPAYENINANAQEKYADAATYTFTIDFGEKVKFDTAYFALYHQMGACVSTPGNNEVYIEYSVSGSDIWNKVGKTGTFYYTTSLADYNDSADPGAVDQITVPLGTTIEATKVRYTFSFLDYALVNANREDPNKGYWYWYCDVLEWTGFTELAVALRTGGDKPKAVTKDQAIKALDHTPSLPEGKVPSEADLKLTIGGVNKTITTEASVLITTPSKHTDYNTKYSGLLLLAPVEDEKNTYYILESYDCKGTEVVFQNEITKGMLAVGFHSDGGDGLERKQAALALELGTKLHLMGVNTKTAELTYSNAMLYTVAGEDKVEIKGEESEDPVESSEPVESEDPVESSEPEPVESSEPEPVESEGSVESEDTAESSEPAPAESSEKPASSGGFPVGAIIGIIAGVIVVCAVVFIIIKKKK